MPSFPFGELVSIHAAADPDAPAVTCAGQTLTRRELDLRTNRRARFYQQRGVGLDSLVALVLPNSVELIEAVVATWKLGATPLILTPAMPEAELEPILDLAQPALVVRAGDETTDPANWADTDEVALPAQAARRWRASTSGGSTGRPKLVFTEIAARTDPDLKTLRMRRDGCVVVPGPLYHGAPLLFATFGLMRGKHVVLLPKFDPVATMAALAENHADFVLLVPTMMNRISKLPADVRDSYDLSGLEGVLHLGASCPTALKREWIEWLGPDRIHELYAGTEGQAMTWITGRQWLEHPGSVGRPVGGAIMKAFDGEFAELPPGEVGEIYMKPPDGAKPTYSYVGATARANEGWESLGDMGWVDADGFVYIIDRRTDMIVTGGSNVYPAEVEVALEAHPTVRSAVVIGIPDDDLGRRVHALVEPVPGQSLTEADLREFLADRLVRYKTPRTFEFVDFPLRDDDGKTRRSAFADRVG
jgi:bile acid-coenzyme A ligase